MFETRTNSIYLGISKYIHGSRISPCSMILKKKLKINLDLHHSMPVLLCIKVHQDVSSLLGSFNKSVVFPRLVFCHNFNTPNNIVNGIIDLIHGVQLVEDLLVLHSFFLRELSNEDFIVPIQINCLGIVGVLRARTTSIWNLVSNLFINFSIRNVPMFLFNLIFYFFNLLFDAGQ